MRPVLLTSEAGEVSRASGTAVAVSALVAALATNGVALAVVRPAPHRLGHTVGRALFNAQASVDPALYDVVLGVGGDGATAAARAGLPFVALPKALYSEVVVHERGLTRALLRRHAGWEAGGARCAQLLVAPSQAAARVAREQWGVDPGRIVVIPEPFDAAGWCAPTARAAAGPGRVLMVAHLYPRKRAGDLLAAWPAVLAARPGTRLDIVGGGPELRALRRAAGAVGGVRVLGHLEPAQLPGMYARADVAVSTSAHETFGYAVLEALAAGLPVVYADAPAVAEMCADAVGRRVPVADPAALAAGIVAMLEPSAAAEARRLNPRIAERCLPADVGARYLAALGELSA